MLKEKLTSRFGISGIPTNSHIRKIKLLKSRILKQFLYEEFDFCKKTTYKKFLNKEVRSLFGKQFGKGKKEKNFKRRNQRNRQKVILYYLTIFM